MSKTDVATTFAGCVGAVLGAVALVVALALVVAVITQWAWNGVVPEVFQLPTITFWQAFQLNLLAGLLLKSNVSSSSKR